MRLEDVTKLRYEIISNRVLSYLHTRYSSLLHVKVA